VGGLFLDFEAVRTESSDHDAPRMTMASSRVVPRRGGLITVHELHQTIREIGQELSIDDVCATVFLSHRESDDEPSFSLQPY